MHKMYVLNGHLARCRILCTVFRLNQCFPKYTLRVLINDWVEEKPWELEGEHGLSFYIETPESKFLFDCGHTGAAWRNAVKMGVDLSEVDFVALSHSHYDHAGGFPALLEHVKPRTLYTGPRAC